MSQHTLANITNGDFESFTNASPDGWTTIDSGIQVTQSTHAYQGNSAASISVTTGTQSATDFRQSIAVIAGETYDFSVWLYHTEGAIKARLYVDGYQNYSNAALTNQWQQLSYRYNASNTGNIEVGLRFYDQSGFDGAEEVLVDLFEPTEHTTQTTGCSSNPVLVSILTDNYGAETSWEITNGNNQLATGNGYSNNTQYNIEQCLSDGQYSFTIYDSQGDGLCCNQGNGAYQVTTANITLASGGSFTSFETTAFALPVAVNDDGDDSPADSGSDDDSYYRSVSGLSGNALKNGLHNLIAGHNAQSYSALWSFYSANELDIYYENDGSILDIYSERPASSDPYNFTPANDQCGTYRNEGDCYNREHSFPRSWFGGAVAPMNSDVHHVFPTDGKVNAMRGSYPYGTVGNASSTSQNGSKLGAADSALGYSGTVFEPIDEFKGDVARALFYMATRYQDVIGNWQNNTSYSDAVLDGSSDQVFEGWFLTLLLAWHSADPVSQKERDRNAAAYSFQGNRNPFVDHPEYVSEIWGQ